MVCTLLMYFIYVCICLNIKKSQLILINFRYIYIRIISDARKCVRICAKCGPHHFLPFRVLIEVPGSARLKTNLLSLSSLFPFLLSLSTTKLSLKQPAISELSPLHSNRLFPVISTLFSSNFSFHGKPRFSGLKESVKNTKNNKLILQFTKFSLKR